MPMNGTKPVRCVDVEDDATLDGARECVEEDGGTESQTDADAGAHGVGRRCCAQLQPRCRPPSAQLQSESTPPPVLRLSRPKAPR